MSDQNQQKQNAAIAAMQYVKPNAIVGVGTGSTVNYFIDELAKIKHNIEGVVVSSKQSEQKCREHGIEIIDLNTAGQLPVYIDGADEIDKHFYMIKGGGAALTQEKIVASSSKQFICIVDESKYVSRIGKFPLPIEVIPMARSFVARQIVKMGGDPEYRDGVITDNGNVILDVYNLEMLNPVEVESKLNQIAGVVCNGIFAMRPADVVLLGKADGVDVIDSKE